MSAGNRIVRVLLPWIYAVCGVVQAAPESGWWWNPNESGRGFFVESHSGVAFIGAYLYDTDGHALWLVSGGQNADPYNYTGDLYYGVNGQPLFGSYMPPSNLVVVGKLSAHFTDDTHGTVTWPGGVVQIERQRFGAGVPVFTPYRGWWWNPAESGSGYSVEKQGNSLFIVAFSYEATGRPVWYFSAGPMSSETTFHGDVVQYANGQTMGGPYHPPGTPVKVATLDVTFTDEIHATFAFTQVSAAIDGVIAPKLAATRTTNTEVELGVKPATYTLPDGFTGTFSIDAKSEISVGGFGPVDAEFTINVTGASFRKDLASGVAGRYVLTSGTVSSSYYEVDDEGNGTCIGTRSPSLSADLIGKVILKVYTYVNEGDSAEQPQVDLYLPEGLNFITDVTCTILGQTFGGQTKSIDAIYDSVFETQIDANGYIVRDGTKFGQGPKDTTVYHLNLTPDK